MSDALINASNAIRFAAAAKPLTSNKGVNLRGRSKRLRADMQPSPVTILRDSPEGAVLTQIEFRQSGKPTAAGQRELAKLYPTT